MNTRWQFWIPAALVLIALVIAMFTVPDSLHRPVSIALPAATLIIFVLEGRWKRVRNQRSTDKDHGTAAPGGGRSGEEA